MQRTAEQIYFELLVLRCRRGDQDAWDELVASWNPRLLYYLRRLLPDEDSAWNVAQEVWLQVVRGLRSLRDPGRWAPWLYAIARRTAMSQLRRQYRVAETIHREHGDSRCDEGAEDAVDADLIDNAEFVHHGLSRIGPAEREALALYFLQDLTIAEIAEVLTIPVGTVKWRLHKARQDLRRVLERELR